MKRSRTGTTLVEVLAVTAMLGAFIELTAPMWADLVREIPAQERAAAAHRQIAGALQWLQRDMDRASDLPVSDGNMRASETTLLIRAPEGIITYEWAGGTLKRTDTGEDEAPRAWSIPEAVIRWRAVTDGAVKSLEVHTAVEVQIGNRRLEKLACASVFRVGGAWPAAGPRRQEGQP